MELSKDPAVILGCNHCAKPVFLFRAKTEADVLKAAAAHLAQHHR